MLNVAFGGTLHQDVDAQANLPAAHPHSGTADIAHQINLVANSKLQNLFGADRMPANSYHHQAVKQIAPGFVANAFSDDNLIEGIEHTQSKFIIGIQCHPELLWQDRSTKWDKLFTAFVAAATEFAKNT